MLDGMDRGHWEHCFAEDSIRQCSSGHLGRILESTEGTLQPRKIEKWPAYGKAPQVLDWDPEAGCRRHLGPCPLPASPGVLFLPC